MSSLAGRKKVYEDYTSAVNERNVEKILSFYEENIEMNLNNVTFIKGKNQLRAHYERITAKPNYSVQIIKYLPVDFDDRIRVHLKVSNGRELDVIYVFSKENPEHIANVFGVLLKTSK